MEQNEPVPVTAAVAVVAETQAPKSLQPGSTYYVNANGVLTEKPAALVPAPTWRRANRGELAMWFGIGAASVIVVEILAAAAWAIAQVQW